MSGSPVSSRNAPFSGCRANSTAAISVPNGGASWTSVTLDTEAFDTDNYHSTSVNTSRMTAPTAAYYMVGATVAYTSAAGGARFARLILNGATVFAASSENALSGFDTPVSLASVYQLAAGDYVEVQGYQNSGGALNISNATYPVVLWIVRLGA